MLVNVIDRHGVLSTVWICEKTSQFDVGTVLMKAPKVLMPQCMYVYRSTKLTKGD